jgi:PPP family 3-phenylpropionic acid transporter
MERLRPYAPHIYYFFFFAAAASYAPFLAFWLKESGLTNQQVGIIYSIGPMIALFVQPMWGFLCDRFCLEKKALLLCSLMTPLIAFGYSTGAGFAVYALTAVLLAFFSSPMAPLADAITVSHVNKYRQSFGGARVWGSIGFAAIVVPMGLLYGVIGIHWMFFFYLAGMIVVFAVTLFLEKGSVRKQVSWRDLARLFGNKEFAVFMLFVFFVAYGAQSYGVFFSVYVGTTGSEVAEKIGMLSFISASSELPFFIFANWLCKRFGYSKILAAGALAGSIRLFVLSLDPSLPALMANQLFQGAAFGLFYAAGVQYAYQISPEGMKTTGQTLFSMIFANMAILASSNAGGWLIDHHGFSTMFGTAAGLSLIGCLGFIFLPLLSRFLKFGAAGAQGVRNETV